MSYKVPRMPGALPLDEMLDLVGQAILGIYNLISRNNSPLYKNDIHYSSGKKLNPHTFYDLKRRNYLQVGVDDSVVLTNKARIKIIEQIVARNDPDHKYRLISFDIPERLRSQRNLFRRTIKRMGFKQIQKSLWVTDRNVGDLVEIVAREYKVEQYVAYFISEKSNIDNFIAEIIKKK